jgi:hypothetical protein
MLNLHQPHGSFGRADLMLNLHQPHGSFGRADLMLNRHEPDGKSVYRIIAVLRYIDPCPGLPWRVRRPLRCAPHLRASAPPREPV